jgi:hypothetical protein
MLSRVDKIERKSGLFGPGCIWCGDHEDPADALNRYFAKWPKDVGKDIVVLSWAPATPLLTVSTDVAEPSRP